MLCRFGLRERWSGMNEARDAMDCQDIQSSGVSLVGFGRDRREDGAVVMELSTDAQAVRRPQRSPGTDENRSALLEGRT